jgi:hypothetical protein
MSEKKRYFSNMRTSAIVEVFCPWTAIIILDDDDNDDNDPIDDDVDTSDQMNQREERKNRSGFMMDGRSGYDWEEFSSVEIVNE